MQMKIVVVPLYRHQIQKIKFQAMRPVGVIVHPDTQQIAVVGEAQLDAPVIECTFTMVKPDEVFDPSKLGGRLGVTPWGDVVYGSCFANV